jgi:hypothetical protein
VAVGETNLTGGNRSTGPGEKLIVIKPTKCTDFSNLILEQNSACFGQFLCPSSGV